jgi:3-oxoacyl-[acyl-carrier protein] reductase
MTPAPPGLVRRYCPDDLAVFTIEEEDRPHGIWAIAVSPGAVDTEMLHVANPFRASLTPDDVAWLISDLLDGRIEAMSGVNVPLFSNR